MKIYFQDALTTIYHGDYFLTQREAGETTLFADDYFDCIITDPPYWTLDKWRNVGTTTRLGGNSDPDKQSGWFQTISPEELWLAMCELHRVLKKNCHCYLMSDGQTLKSILGYSDEAGFQNFKPIVWDKVSQGMGYHYRCRHEYFVMLDKGKNRKLSSLSTPDVWEVPMIRGGYPTEKPVELMEIPINHSTNPGELVFDPFMGGGSTLIAARLNSRRSVGMDISERACELAAKRIQADAGAPKQEELIA